MYKTLTSLRWWTWTWETPGNGDGHGCLACCSPCSHWESDVTEEQHHKAVRTATYRVKAQPTLVPLCSVLQSCPTLCSLMDYSLPGSSVHWILQTRRVEWVVIPISRGSSLPRDPTWVSCIAGRFLAVWANRGTQGHNISSKISHPIIQYWKPEPIFIYLNFFFFVVNFVIHWNEKALGSHVFPIYLNFYWKCICLAILC